MACACKCPRCGRNIRRHGVLEDLGDRRVGKRCPCGALKVGVVWYPSGREPKVGSDRFPRAH